MAYVIRVKNTCYLSGADNLGTLVISQGLMIFNFSFFMNKCTFFIPVFLMYIVFCFDDVGVNKQAYFCTLLLLDIHFYKYRLA